MRIVYCLLIAALSFAPLFPAEANEPLAIVTAADSAIDTLSPDTLKLVYLRKSQMDARGNRWIPLNLPMTDPLRRDFSQALFAMQPEEQDDYWNAQYFHGITPPTVMTSEEAVLRFVTSTPGSLGYVRKQKADSRVKILLLMTPPSAK